MRLDDLETGGAFAAQEMFRERVGVRDADGKERTVEALIRELPAEDFETMFPLMLGAQDELQPSRIRMAQELVGVAVMVERDGEAPVPMGVATSRRLRLGWLMPLFNAAMKHNGGGAKN
jgi:hypothetical protein